MRKMFTPFFLSLHLNSPSKLWSFHLEVSHMAAKEYGLHSNWWNLPIKAQEIPITRTAIKPSNFFKELGQSQARFAGGKCHPLDFIRLYMFTVTQPENIRHQHSWP